MVWKTQSRFSGQHVCSCGPRRCIQDPKKSGSGPVPSALSCPSLELPAGVASVPTPRLALPPRADVKHWPFSSLQPWLR